MLISPGARPANNRQTPMCDRGGGRRVRLPVFLALPALALLITGCATTGPVSASGTPVRPEKLKEAQRLVEEQGIPNELRPCYIALYSEGSQNAVLHAMRGGLAAMRLKRFDLAKQLFDRAIAGVEALQEGADQAERAKSKFVKEQEKWFKGESYERAALFLYRGLLYLHDGDFGNAAACFKRSQLQDIKGEDMKDFEADWGSSELGLALASYKLNDSEAAQAALTRAALFPSRQGDVPPPTPDTNLLIVVEVGEGPVKYRSGQHGEQLRFAETPSAIREIEFGFPGSPSFRSAAAENLCVQATTRGTRQVDYILHGKAAFKEGTGAAALGLGTAAIATSQSDKNGIASGVLGLLALGSAIASATTEPAADIRSWDNLPHSIYLLNLTVPKGQDVVELSAVSNAGAKISSLTVPLPPAGTPEKPLQVIFVRM